MGKGRLALQGLWHLYFKTLTYLLYRLVNRSRDFTYLAAAEWPFAAQSQEGSEPGRDAGPVLQQHKGVLDQQPALPQLQPTLVDIQPVTAGQVDNAQDTGIAQARQPSAEGAPAQAEPSLQKSKGTTQLPGEKCKPAKYTHPPAPLP